MRDFGLVNPKNVLEPETAFQTTVREAAAKYLDNFEGKTRDDKRFMLSAMLGEIAANEVSIICGKLGPVADLIQIAEEFGSRVTNDIEAFRDRQPKPASSSEGEGLEQPQEQAA